MGDLVLLAVAELFVPVFGDMDHRRCRVLVRYIFDNHKPLPVGGDVVWIFDFEIRGTREAE